MAIAACIAFFVLVGFYFDPRRKKNGKLSPGRLRAARILILVLAAIAICLRLKAMRGG